MTKTKELIERGTKVIYEATFCFDGILVMVDILRICEDGLIINEVKSSTSVKDVYIDDASIQYYVISSLGYKVSAINIIHIDNSYVRGEKLELEKFFHTEDVTEQVKQKQADIPQIVSKFDEILAKTLSQRLISALTAQTLIIAMLGSTAGASSEAYQSIVFLTYLA
ncbi:hypothetical protein VB002_12915 [Campylobacter concisus]